MPENKFKAKYDEDTATFRQVYRKVLYRHKAKSDEDMISLELFKKLSSSPCHYCGEEPSREVKYRYSEHTIKINGLDRVDNTKGYIETNVVPCCNTCNMAKGTMEHKKFVEWVERVYQNYIIE